MVAQEAEATARSRKTAVRNDADAAPIAYLAAWLGIDASDRERVFQWQVAAIVLCADPFALALMWAVGSVRRRR
jgi:cytochrome P450